MSSKTVSISARITHEDAEFISQLKINGAKTPSDKLRAIIADARRRDSRTQDYRGCFQMIQEIMKPVIEKIRHAELENNVHSELITRCVEWLPDTIAYTVSSVHEFENAGSRDQLENTESGVSDRVFRLMESVMQMGITRRCPCYDEDAISNRIHPILELSNVIMATSKSKRKESK